MFAQLIQYQSGWLKVDVLLNAPRDRLDMDKARLVSRHTKPAGEVFRSNGWCLFLKGHLQLVMGFSPTILHLLFFNTGAAELQLA